MKTIDYKLTIRIAFGSLGMARGNGKRQKGIAQFKLFMFVSL